MVKGPAVDLEEDGEPLRIFEIAYHSCNEIQCVRAQTSRLPLTNCFILGFTQTFIFLQ